MEACSIRNIMGEGVIKGGLNAVREQSEERGRGGVMKRVAE
jgi:hypothetical protein